MYKHIKLIPVFIVLLLISGTFLSGCKDSTVTPDPTNPFKIYGIVVDAVSSQIIANANLTLSFQGGAVVKEGQSGTDGTFKFEELGEGLYTLSVSMSGYKNMQADSILVNEAQGGAAYVALVPVDINITQPVGAVSGLVLDHNNNPVANALLSISADDMELTNGYFANASSNSAGQFYLGAVSVNSSSGTPIPSFKVRCVKSGFLTAVVSGIIVNENKSVQVNFKLSQAPPVSVIFEDNFETNKNWVLNGYWNRFANNTNIKNKAYPKYVKLAPDDNSNGSLPSAYGGSYTIWYGEILTGNFMGEPSTFQDSLSGGTGQSRNEGSATSPSITVSSTTGAASVSFWTWWEIESVNPNSSGFDIMEVEVFEITDTSNITVLGKLNPYSDPILDDRAALPYTSTGFNKAPIWTYQEFDISAFIGKTIKIRFFFDTRDALYNGFRGWLIDDVKVTDKLSEGGLNKSYKKTSEPMPTRK